MPLSRDESRWHAISSVTVSAVQNYCFIIFLIHAKSCLRVSQVDEFSLEISARCLQKMIDLRILFNFRHEKKESRHDDGWKQYALKVIQLA